MDELSRLKRSRLSKVCKTREINQNLYLNWGIYVFRWDFFQFATFTCHQSSRLVVLGPAVLTNNSLTYKKYFRRISLVSKTFPGFPSMGVELLVLSNSVLPEREIQEIF